MNYKKFAQRGGNRRPVPLAAKKEIQTKETAKIVTGGNLTNLDILRDNLKKMEAQTKPQKKYVKF